MARKKLSAPLPEFTSQFCRGAKYNNLEVVKLLKETIKEFFPELEVKIKLNPKRTEPDHIVFRFTDQLPANEILEKIKQIIKQYRQLHYRNTKSYSQWEVNFNFFLKVREVNPNLDSDNIEEEEENNMDED